MLNLYYHELMGKVKEHKGKKYLMLDDYVLDKVLERLKKPLALKNLTKLKYITHMINYRTILPYKMF